MAVFSKPKIFQLLRIEEETKIEGFQREEVTKALRYVFVFIGLRADQIPGEEEANVLKDYVIEEYAGHTTEEIKLAFKMAIQGKLGLLSKDAKCYGVFSPAYFTLVMDAYRQWAREQAEKLARKSEPIPIVSEIEKKRIDLAYAGFLRSQYPATVLDFITINK